MYKWISKWISSNIKYIISNKIHEINKQWNSFQRLRGTTINWTNQNPKLCSWLLEGTLESTHRFGIYTPQGLEYIHFDLSKPQSRLTIFGCLIPIHTGHGHVFFLYLFIPFSSPCEFRGCTGAPPFYRYKSWGYRPPLQSNLYRMGVHRFFLTPFSL